MLLLYILFGVYLIAVNIYSFMLVRSQKQASHDRDHTPKNLNGKLLISGFLGGAIAAYAALFLLKFKTDNLLLMIILPILAVLNIYLIIILFRNGFFISL